MVVRTLHGSTAVVDSSLPAFLDSTILIYVFRRTNDNNPAENPTIGLDSTRECGFQDVVVKHSVKTKFDGLAFRCVRNSCRVRS